LAPPSALPGISPTTWEIGSFTARHTPETRFNTPEKLAKTSPVITIPAVAEALRHNAKRWSANMQRRSTGWMAALTGISLAMLAVAQSGAEAAVTRSEYCSRLGLQLDGVIQAKAEPGADAREIAEATALQDKANRLCAERKQAQGIRTFANALKLLGVTPVDLNQ
jgi:hypothetical protein